MERASPERSGSIRGVAPTSRQTNTTGALRLCQQLLTRQRQDWRHWCAYRRLYLASGIGNHFNRRARLCDHALWHRRNHRIIYLVTRRAEDSGRVSEWPVGGTLGQRVQEWFVGDCVGTDAECRERTAGGLCALAGLVPRCQGYRPRRFDGKSDSHGQSCDQIGRLAPGAATGDGGGPTQVDLPLSCPHGGSMASHALYDLHMGGACVATGTTPPGPQGIESQVPGVRRERKLVDSRRRGRSPAVAARARWREGVRARWP
mmetsp:Transcript_16408/g.38274  ORF Transcript_16408/g.38274 Transcript_16408/m.38274 type:complete len:260 (+) Transcript_16408:2820-3599(+)